MRRPVGVILAAAVLAFMTIFGFLATLLSVVAMFMVHSPIIPRLPAVQAITAVVNLLFFCFLVFCAWTVMGLFRLRLRARVSMVVIGALTAVFFSVVFAALIRLRSSIPPGMTVPGGSIEVSSVLLALGLIYAALALIGVWWVVYFNLRPVRLAFARAGALDENAS